MPRAKQPIEESEGLVEVGEDVVENPAEPEAEVEVPEVESEDTPDELVVDEVEVEEVNPYPGVHGLIKAINPAYEIGDTWAPYHLVTNQSGTINKVEWAREQAHSGS